MKAYIENILAEVEAYADYVLNDTSYTEAYDGLLADDSAYHNNQWQDVICKALEADGIDPDLYDHVAQSIIDNPTGYCDISVKQGYFWQDDLCVASFPIGELELYQQWPAQSGAFRNAIVEYLNSNSDHFFKIEGDYISCYLDFSDCNAAYILRPDDIKRCREEYYS